MRVELKCEFNVAMAKQRLHRFRIGADTDEKRGEAVAQIMKSKAPRTIIPWHPGMRKGCRPSLQPAADDLSQACWQLAVVRLPVGRNSQYLVGRCDCRKKISRSSLGLLSRGQGELFLRPTSPFKGDIAQSVREVLG
jgi:hypothetical protein